MLRASWYLCRCGLGPGKIKKQVFVFTCPGCKISPKVTGRFSLKEGTKMMYRFCLRSSAKPEMYLRSVQKAKGLPPHLIPLLNMILGFAFWCGALGKKLAMSVELISHLLEMVQRKIFFKKNLHFHFREENRKGGMRPANVLEHRGNSTQPNPSQPNPTLPNPIQPSPLHSTPTQPNPTQPIST